MSESSDIRIDKFLWVVRLYKTRSLASEDCAKGRVLLNEQPVKPSKVVKVGDVIAVKTPPIYRSYEILALAKNRMGAKLVAGHIKDVTSPEQLNLLEMAHLATSLGRRKGTGRPTKKERRDLEELFEGDFE